MTRHWGLRQFTTAVKNTLPRQCSVLVPMAHGSEELEAICIVNTLRRGDVGVTIASCSETQYVTCSRLTTIKCDVMFDSISLTSAMFDAIILPGGTLGAKNLSEHEGLQQLMTRQKHSGQLYGAICASPAVCLERWGLLNDIESVTGYPAPEFVSALGGKYHASSPVVVDRNCITSRGPGTSIGMGLKLLELLRGKEVSESVRKGMLVDL